ncbi:ABC transporter ATP-binding protein [Microbacterium allomyrinae]|uniref:ABC-type quaternary amine transporter n=1 Tax=Microbacterium allomyrinae TaxID=2830666 RepID=A0A9X1S2E5_9MICO|nr:ABC transporter ATP-binding protein [Microbacterium allomyrinae]MCC2032621.1 ABC transporter ATP-binding protein [Microbacterium allomyrinae]
MTAISVSRVSKDYGRHRVLHEVDLEIDDGEFIVLLGSSGSGKSTLLRLIAGLERVDSGTIAFDGKVVSAAASTVPANKRSLGFVFQSYALWPHLSVAQNVEYPLRARRHRPRADIRTRARHALDLVHMERYADRQIGQLSGGQQQRVALARAIVAQPGLLLFDEPLSNLDSALRIELRAEIRRLHRELGFTAVYVTHDNAEAAVLADRIAVVDEGRVSPAASVPDFFAHPGSDSFAVLRGFDNRVDATVMGDDGPGAQSVRIADEVRASVRVTDRFDEGARVVLVGRARSILVHPAEHGSSFSAGPPTAARFRDVAVTELTESSTGYTARFTLAGTALSGVLSPTEWDRDPRAKLQAAGWRADVSIDWSQMHAVSPRS